MNNNIYPTAYGTTPDHTSFIDSLVLSNISGILLSIAIILIIFLIIRFILLWYWRINDIVKLLEKIENNTKAGVITPNKTNEIEPIKPDKPS